MYDCLLEARAQTRGPCTLECGLHVRVHVRVCVILTTVCHNVLIG